MRCFIALYIYDISNDKLVLIKFVIIRIVLGNIWSIEGVSFEKVRTSGTDTLHAEPGWYRVCHDTFPSFCYE